MNNNQISQTRRMSAEAMHPMVFEATAFWRSFGTCGKYKSLFDGKHSPLYKETNPSNFLYIRCKGILGKEGRISSRPTVADIFAEVEEYLDDIIKQYEPEDIFQLNGAHRADNPGCEGQDLKTKAHGDFLKRRDRERQALPVATDETPAENDGSGLSGIFQTDDTKPPEAGKDYAGDSCNYYTKTEVDMRIKLLQNDISALKKLVEALTKSKGVV